MRLPTYRFAVFFALVFLAVWTLFTLFPFYFQFITGFKSIGEVNQIHPSYWPQDFKWANFPGLFDDARTQKSLIDSFIIATCNTVLSLLLGASAGYALARFPRRAGGENVSFWILSNRMFPPVAILLPMFYAFEWVFGSTDNHMSLIVLYLVFNMPLATWLMMIFFREVPPELEQASYMDGHGAIKTFFTVTLPLVGPGMVSVAMLCWIFAWNEYLFANLFVGGAVVTHTIQIPTFVQGAQQLTNLAIAFSIIAMLPPIILFIILRRYMVRGLSLGVVKG